MKYHVLKPQAGFVLVFSNSSIDGVHYGNSMDETKNEHIFFY